MVKIKQIIKCHDGKCWEIIKEDPFEILPRNSDGEFIVEELIVLKEDN